MNKKPTAIFYLSDLALIIQSEKAVIKNISFPKDLVKDGEILDTERFLTFLSQEIEGVAKKIKIGVILLGSGLLYQRSVTKEDDLEKAKDELFESLPFDKKFISERTIVTSSRTYLLATHKLFFNTVIKACEQSSIAIIAVLPLSLFSDQEIVKTVDKSIINAVLSKEELYEDGSFLRDEEMELPAKEIKIDDEEEKIQEPEKTDEVAEKTESPTSSGDGPYSNVQVWNTPRLVLVLGFLIALTCILGGLIYLQMNKFVLPGKMAQETPAPTVTAPTPTEAPKEVAKADLTVLVENGTGTAGQAGAVKELLEGIGYTIVETGNAETSDHERTEVVFSSKVSEKQQQEIKDLLLESFTAVTTSIDQAAATDVTVITGSTK